MILLTFFLFWLAIKKGFEPLLPGFKCAPFNDLTYLKKLVNKKTAGILIELIQGEGGINEADKEFIKELYNFAKKNNSKVVPIYLKKNEVFLISSFKLRHYKLLS